MISKLYIESVVSATSELENANKVIAIEDLIGNTLNEGTITQDDSKGSHPLMLLKPISR